MFGGDDLPCYAAPARAEDLAGLPPTYIMVGTLDGFAPGAAVARQARKDMNNWLGRQLA
jgi:acetyl esterase/lipase